MVKNKNSYSGEVVEAPKYWKSGPGHPQTELAYITQAEKDALVDLDIHGTLKDGPHKGPAGITSLNGWESDFSRDWGGGGESQGSPPGHDPGGGSTAREVAIATQATTPTKPIQQTGGDDIEDDPAQLGQPADFIPTDTKTTLDKAIDLYQTVSPIGIATDLLKEPVNQYEGITGEDEYGHGDFQYDNVVDYAKNEHGVDYSLLDNEEQAVVDKAFSASGGLSESARDIGLPSEQMETIYTEPETVTTGGESVYTPPVTQADVTPENTEFTPEDDAAAVAALEYGTDFPTDIGAMPYPDYRAAQGDLSGLIDPRMQRAYAENIQSMVDSRLLAAQGGRIGYYNGELVEDNDEEETHRASALASLPEYRMFSQRRKAMLGGRMGYNQGGIVSRQPFFLGGVSDAIGGLLGGAKKVVKKITKSPIGKAALLGGLGAWGLGAGPFANLPGQGFLKGNFMKKMLLNKAKEGGWDATKWALKNVSPWKATAGITAISSIPLWAKPQNWDEMDEAEQEAWLKKYYADVAAKKAEYGETIPTEFQPLPYQFAAKGGRIGYRTGKGVTSLQAGAPNIKYEGNMKKIEGQTAGPAWFQERLNILMDLGYDYETAGEIAHNTPEYLQIIAEVGGFAQGGRIGYRTGKGVESLPVDQMKDIEGQEAGLLREMFKIHGRDQTMSMWNDFKIMKMEGSLPPGIITFEDFINAHGDMFGGAEGGRVPAQEGGLMNLGGMEKDYRQEGGFVPIGGQEKADDVPARLSKNEFVFTADAVRAAGGGDIDEGAAVMERLMENLEAGGKVSEESQGLEGAREMFANTQKLQNRII